jgi:hypothetical protein
MCYPCPGTPVPRFCGIYPGGGGGGGGSGDRDQETKPIGFSVFCLLNLIPHPTSLKGEKSRRAAFLRLSGESAQLFQPKFLCSNHKNRKTINHTEISQRKPRKYLLFFSLLLFLCVSVSLWLMVFYLFNYSKGGGFTHRVTSMMFYNLLFFRCIRCFHCGQPRNLGSIQID